jgi:aspartyl-tRNA(Asn)/glutamyl-tRNA(Gln) amidotransferase subunit A
MGMQIIGKYFDEAKILNVAHQFQQHTDWHKQKATAITAITAASGES